MTKPHHLALRLSFRASSSLESPLMSTVTPAPTAEHLVAELDASLTEAVRRAANRAEHMRLVRMQGLVTELKSLVSGPAPVSTAPPGAV